MEEWTCAMCKLPIHEQCLCVFDKYFHVDCFVCKKCKTVIDGSQCVEKNGDPYCLRCGTSSCAGCKQPIVAGGAFALDRNWHLECFVCVECKKSFDGDDGQFAANEHQQPTCLSCSSKITELAQKKEKKRLGRSRRGKHAQRCDTCQQPLAPNATMLVALGRAYHRHCFVCSKCKKLLEGAKFVAVGSKPACHDCAADRLAERCTACKKPITGTIVVALGRNWHPGCLNCMSCQQPIMNYGKVYRRGKQPCCPACVETVFNKRTSARLSSMAGKKAKKKKRGAELMGSLQALLADDVGIDYFLRYLVTEYSVENLLFYLDVTQFRVLQAEHDREIYSKSIYCKYLQPDAELELNLDHATKTRVCDRIDSPSSDMFDEAMEAILCLMNDCSFQRFLNSPEGKELRDLQL